MSFYNKSVHRAIGFIQNCHSEQKAGTYKTKSCRSGLLLDGRKSPQLLVEDLDHVPGTLLGLNPTAKTKGFPKMPVGLAWEKCLPGINWVIRITLKCQGQAWRGTSASPQSTSHSALATDASKEGGKWKIQLHHFGVGHDPPWSLQAPRQPWPGDFSSGMTSTWCCFPKPGDKLKNQKPELKVFESPRTEGRKDHNSHSSTSYRENEHINALFIKLAASNPLTPCQSLTWALGHGWVAPGLHLFLSGHILNLCLQLRLFPDPTPHAE